MRFDCELQCVKQDVRSKKRVKNIVHEITNKTIQENKI